VTTVTNRVTANTDQIEGVDATNQIRDSILDDATRFSGARIDATISSRLASASYTAPPSAAANADAVWDELRTDHVGAGSFGQGVASVQGNVTGSTATIGPNGLDASALAADAATEIVTAIFARAFNADYGSKTFDELMKILVSEAAGKVSGMDTGSPVFRSIGDTKDVISATTTAEGNRTAVSYNP
jgi:hypothetical protein